MEQIVQMIMQGSVELDGVVLVRLIVYMMSLELFVVAMGLIGRSKGR